MAVNQQLLFDAGIDEKRAGRSGSFVDNMKLPVHRWFRYSAGFSAAWVREVVASAGPHCKVLDPFAGSGTVVIEAEQAGTNGIGLEAHPFLVRVAQTKLCWGNFILNGVRLLKRPKKRATSKRASEGRGPTFPRLRVGLPCAVPSRTCSLMEYG